MAFFIFAIIGTTGFVHQNHRKFKFTRDFILIIFSAVLIATPWLLYLFMNHQEEFLWMMSQLVIPVGEVIQGHSGSAFYYFETVGIVFGEIIYLPLIWLVSIVWKRRTLNRILIFSWIFIPFILLSFCATKRITYLAMCAPAYFILTALFIRFLIFNFKKVKLPPILKYVVLIFLIGLPIRYSLERLKPAKARFQMPAWRTEMKKLNDNSKYSERYVALFNEPKYLDAMFFYDFMAYERDLNGYEITLLKTKNYLVYENVDGEYELR